MRFPRFLVALATGAILTAGTVLADAPPDSQGYGSCLLYTSPSPRDRQKSRMPSSA